MITNQSLICKCCICPIPKQSVISHTARWPDGGRNDQPSHHSHTFHIPCTLSHVNHQYLIHGWWDIPYWCTKFGGNHVRGFLQYCSLIQMARRTESLKFSRKTHSSKSFNTEKTACNLFLSQPIQSHIIALFYMCIMKRIQFLRTLWKLCVCGCSDGIPLRTHWNSLYANANEGK